MLEYENQRTSSIVSRLTAAGNTIRLIVIIISVIVFGALLAFLGLSYVKDAWWIIGAIGLGIGYVLGSYLASYLPLFSNGWRSYWWRKVRF